jgi:hypothetical protein
MSDPDVVGRVDAIQNPDGLSARVPIHAAPEVDRESVRVVYQQVCDSYHAIDEFRMKLLGFLPLTSIVGLLVLEKGTLGALTSVVRNELVAYVAFFAAAFTLALFIYEIRGIRRSHGLVRRGRELETALNIRGQFWVCTEEATAAVEPSTYRRRAARPFNAKVAACFMYSLVLAAWIFVALRYGLAWDARTCGLWAIAFGGMVGMGTYLFLVRKLIPA